MARTGAVLALFFLILTAGCLGFLMVTKIDKQPHGQPLPQPHLKHWKAD